MEKVVIYTFTYRNEHIFSLVLDSYLRQTYQNIEVHVFDNSLSEGYMCIKTLCLEKKDSRITYIPNASQLGAHGSFSRILSSIALDNYAIVLASDMALSDNAVEELVSLKRSTGAALIMPATRNYKSALLDLYPGRSIFDQAYESLPPLAQTTSVFPTEKILEKYFGQENLKGEFFKFSFFGCLFDGSLIAGIGRNYIRFKFHGGEQYLSLNLLIRSNYLACLPNELLWNFFGHDRLGGTERLDSDLGRMECIQACQMVLEEYEFFLLAKGVDVAKMRINQVEKARYFKENFRGFEKYADEIIQRNIFFIE
jgi:glycosyltransferase involved in cell wall biosynthesis